MAGSLGNVLRGAGTVAWHDLKGNARGVRLWILSIFVLLAMLGAAFGLSQLLLPTGPAITTQYVIWPTAVYMNGSPPGLAVFVSDYLGMPRPHLAVALGEPVPLGATSIVFQERARADTNATGWVTFANLSLGFWPVELPTVGNPPLLMSGLVGQGPLGANFTVDVHRFDLLGDLASRDVSLQAMSPQGAPVAGAAVQVNGTQVGTTDGNGFFHIRLADGTWNLTLASGGVSRSTSLSVVARSLLPVLQGPNQFLVFLLSILGTVVPILALIMSYDSVAKERTTGTLELLLARPATRTGLAVGKFLGTFLSVGLPLLGVVLATLLGVQMVTGQWPDAAFATAFVLGTLGLAAVYVLLMELFSVLAKTAGTALLVAVMIWFLFAFIWGVVILGVQAALGIESGTPAYYSLTAAADLFNPNGVANLIVLAFLPAAQAANLGAGTELPNWAGPVAWAVWFVVLLVLVVVAFRRRIV